MTFSEPLVFGRLLRRYKRFLADVALDDGAVVTAHCTNTGSLKTCSQPGWRVALSRASNPKRKLKYTWELVHNETCWIGINTLAANRLAEEGICAEHLPELAGYDTLTREQRYGENSRIDLLLRNTTGTCPDCYVEVKNVSLLTDDAAIAFPDAPTARGRKHLRELRQVVREGRRAVMLYVVQRTDGQVMRPAWEIDPEYAEALCQAVDSGVEAIAYQAEVSPERIDLRYRVPVDLSPVGENAEKPKG